MDSQVENALNLYKKGEIGLKRAWKISKISPFEFRKLLIERNIEPMYDEKITERSLKDALAIDIKRL